MLPLVIAAAIIANSRDREDSSPSVRDQLDTHFKKADADRARMTLGSIPA